MDQLPLHDYLAALRAMDGSDLHLSPGDVPRVRRNGIVTPIPDSTPLSPTDVRLLLDPIMPERARHAWDTSTQADFSFNGGTTLGQFRVNAYDSRAGASAVIRAVPRAVPPADELCLPDAVRRLPRLKSGLVLIVGRGGNGKSTTLAWLVDEVNRTRPANIITMEDPVEFEHHPIQSAITQRELGTDVLSFADALKAALRQAPDLIAVGEIRDAETLTLALRAAETGHLVAGTLHAPSAPGTISRILDMIETHRQDATRRQLADCLQAVVSQTLVPTSNGTGKRIAVFEVLLRNTATVGVIRSGHGDLEGPMALANSGMLTYHRALAERVLEGWVSVDTAFAYARDEAQLRAALRTVGVPI